MHPNPLLRPCFPLFLLLWSGHPLANPCSPVTISCQSSLCQFDFGDSSAPPSLTPWESECVLQGKHSLHYEPLDANYQAGETTFANSAPVAVDIRLAPRPWLFPFEKTPWIHREIPWGFTATLEKHPSLQISHPLSTQIVLESKIQGMTPHLLQWVRWQPPSWKWTQGFGIETATRGTRIWLSTGGRISIKRFLLMPTLDAISHTDISPSAFATPGPEGRLHLQLQYPRSIWAFGLGCGVNVPTQKQQARWGILKPSILGNGSIALQFHPTAIVEFRFTSDIQAHLGFSWRPVLPPESRIQPSPAPDHNSIQKDTAWVADTGTTDLVRWNPDLAKTTNGKRLPTLAEWQKWLTMQSTETQGSICPKGSGEWVLGEGNLKGRLIRTGIPCAKYEEDWEIVEPNAHPTAKIRWWRAVIKP